MTGVLLNVNVFYTLSLVADCVLGVDALVQQLTSVTLEILKNGDYEDHAPSFGVFFEQLRVILSDNVESLADGIALPTFELSLQVDTAVSFSEHVTAQSISGTKKRPNSLTLTPSSPAKIRLKGSEFNDMPQTPNRPAVPRNPAYSGDSVESTEEDNTKRMIGTLIDTTLYTLGRQFRAIPWPTFAKECRLRCSGSLASNSF
jgi:hypothetical protein